MPLLLLFRPFNLCHADPDWSFPGFPAAIFGFNSPICFWIVSGCGEKLLKSDKMRQSRIVA